MKRLVPELRRVLRRHGWLPGLAALLVLLAIAVQLLVLQPMRKELAAERERAERTRQKLQSGALPRRAESGSVGDQLRSFHSFFPRPDSLPFWLETMHRLGRNSGVAMRSGEYRLERPEQGLWRYHVTLPVSGNYLQVRQFIGQVLKEVPAASLDDVQLRREAGPAGRIEARLRFSIHFAGT